MSTSSRRKQRRPKRPARNAHRAGASASLRPDVPHVRLERREDAWCPLVAGADQDLDSAIALCAPLGGVIAAGPLRCERTRLDPVGRHTGLDQRLTNDGDTALAQPRVVLIGPAKKIGGPVDPETHGRVLPHIGRDLGGLIQLGRPNVGPVIVEREVSERPQLGPATAGLRAPAIPAGP